MQRRPFLGPPRRGAHVATRLLWLVIAIMLPLLILSGISIWRVHDSGRTMQEHALLAQARGMAQIIDGEFERIESALEALAAAAPIEGDLTAFEPKLRTVGAQLGSLPMGVSSANGFVLLATSWPPGERIEGVAIGPGSRAAFATKRVSISDLVLSPVSNTLVTVIAVPVRTAGALVPSHVLTAAIPAGRLSSEFGNELIHPTEGMVATVLDREGRVVADTTGNPDAIGHRMRGAVSTHIMNETEGLVRTEDAQSGTRCFQAFARGRLSGYTVVVGVPDKVFDAPSRAVLIQTILIGALLLGTGVLAAGLMARRLVGSLRKLTEPYAGKPIQTGIREIDDVAQQLHRAAEARDRVQSAMDYQLTLLRAVTESTAEAIFMTDPKGRVTYANPEAERMFGWRQEELIGQVLHDVVQRRQADGVHLLERKLAEAVATGRPGIGEEDTFYRRDRSMVAVESSYAPVLVEGRVAGAVLIVRDITTRKRTDAALRKNEARLRDLVSTLDLATILVRDPDDMIRFWSHGCERLYGWTVTEAIGQSSSALLNTVFPEPVANIKASLLRTGEWSGDLVHTRRDGSLITVATRKVLQRDARGEPHAVMMSMIDVTDLRQAQAELRQLNHDLEERVNQEVTEREAAQTRAAHAERMQALGQLAGGIAHDFNNVLQSVLGAASLIERRPNDTAAVRRLVRLIAEGANRGATITRRMLAFARRSDLEAEAIDPAILLDGLREICTYTLGPAIEIRVELAPGLSPLFADKGQLETALVNLAANARDAMPSGGVLTLSAEVEHVSRPGTHWAGLQPGTYVRISVSDTGTGMDRTVLAHIAEPFFTTKGVGKGTGLGLSMVKGFTEQSGGGFGVVSEPGTGTTVSLWLPMAHELVVLPERIEPPSPAPTAVSGIRVLLVDDDNLVRETVAAQLQTAGHTVLSAAGGEEALSLLRATETIDIMVTDLAMPGMNGLTLIREAQALRTRLPAILLTGYAGDAATLAVGGVVSGSYSLIRKPVSGTQLLDRVAAMLEPVG